MRAIAFLLALGSAAAAEPGTPPPPPPYYAVGASVADGAVAFDMASLRRDGAVASIRVWRFSPAPTLDQDRFHVGVVYRAELDCAGRRFRLSAMAPFANLGALEPYRLPESEWSRYTPPAGPPDPSLATTAWRLLCRGELPRSWVGYDRLDLIALDYWSSLAPPATGADPHAIEPPAWAGPNARESTMPQPPQPVVDAPAVPR
jgi:hypothetical protein